MLLLFSKTGLLLCIETLLDMRTLSRDGYRILSATKMMLFVTKVYSWKSLTIVTNISISDVAGVLNSPLIEICTIVMCMVLGWK